MVCKSPHQGQTRLCHHGFILTPSGTLYGKFENARANRLFTKMLYFFNMKHIAIDFGSRKVGIATSDIGGTLAFPHSTIPNDDELLDQVSKIISDEEAQAIVIGKSVNLNGQENKIDNAAIEFAKLLGENTNLEIFWEKEWFSSSEAFRSAKDYANPRNFFRNNTGSNKDIDAKSATIILQRFLDKASK